MLSNCILLFVQLSLPTENIVLQLCLIVNPFFQKK